MAREKQNGKSSKNRRRKGIDWYWALLILVAAFAGTLLLGRPEVQLLRDSAAVTILGKVLISGGLLYFGWFAKSRPPYFGKILMTFMALSPWVRLIINSRRISLLYVTLLVFAGIGYQIYLCVHKDNNATKKRRNSKEENVSPLFLATLFFTFLFFVSARDYAFVEGDNHYLLIGFALALIVGVITGVWCMQAKVFVWQGKGQMIMACALMFIMATFIATGFFLVAATNLNYMLDFSRPEQYTLLVIDKDTDTHVKAPTEYQLILLYEEREITMNVSLSEYQTYEIGDYFQVELYQGFFGDAYYIAD